MRSNTLILLCISILSGCALPVEKAKPGSEVSAVSALVDQRFAVALADCKQSGCVPVAMISLSTSHYWLPISVERVIQIGAIAKPPLCRLSESSDLIQKELALACIAMLEARELHISEPRKDAETGFPIACYSVSP
jgi:hypothetical protein